MFRRPKKEPEPLLIDKPLGDWEPLIPNDKEPAQPPAKPPHSDQDDDDNDEDQKRHG